MVSVIFLFSLFAFHDLYFFVFLGPAYGLIILSFNFPYSFFLFSSFPLILKIYFAYFKSAVVQAVQGVIIRIV